MVIVSVAVMLACVELILWGFTLDKVEKQIKDLQYDIHEIKRRMQE